MIWPFSRGRKLDCSDGRDERNREFPVSAIFADLKHGDLRPVSKHWNCPLTLDQGSEGACCGFAVAHEALAEPVKMKLIDGAVARRLYREAQAIDRWTNNKSGTSINAAMRIAVRWDWYGEYRWAFGIEDLVLAVGHLGPAVLGIDWHKGMQNPKGGFIYPTGGKTGRHAILCNGYDHASETFTLHNSWGRWWGHRGECKIHKGNLNLLLRHGGVAAIPLKRGEAGLARAGGI